MNDVSVLSVFLTIVVGVLIVGTLRIGSFRLKANKYVEEGVPKLITLKKWWHLIYEVYPYEIEKDYNWTKIKSDIQKGVPPELATLREKAVALEMLQHEFSEHYVSYITLRDEEGIFFESLDAYTEYTLSELQHLENDFFLSQMLSSWEDDELAELKRALEDPDSFNEENTDGK
tara:strand:- start:6556 stop:7077 length:522 start_codon:yes stop_codon:yes gene_type:complete